MVIRKLTEQFAVADQVTEADLPGIVAQGFRRLICNRPDSEVEPPLSADTLGRAAQKAGLKFHYMPVDPMGINADSGKGLQDILASSEEPILAYCRSGTRAAALWALANAGTQPADELLEQCANAGYRLDNLKPFLDQASAT